MDGLIGDAVLNTLSIVSMCVYPAHAVSFVIPMVLFGGISDLAVDNNFL